VIPGIYILRNNKNHRLYVGSSINLSKREKSHFSALIRGTHKNPYLQADFNKCGIDFFKFEVVSERPNDELLEVEQLFLDCLFDNQNRCYNISPTAGNTLGRKHKESTKKKISQKAKGNQRWLGKKHTEISKALIGEKSKGRVFSEETKRLLSEINSKHANTKIFKEMISAVHKNKPKSTEQKQKMSAARKAWWDRKKAEND
jgi:group I intron endonuclease